MKRLVLTLMAAVLPMTGEAYTECVMSPIRAWTPLDGTSSVWICFSQGNCVYKQLGGSITEKHLDRMLTMGLTALATNAQMIVRYNADGVVCAAQSTSSDQIGGVWISK
jgi:hypothetical protein